MDALRVDNELNQWFSTYGLITAERIFGRYTLRVPAEQLLVAIKNPGNFYYLLLQVPLKNIFNGILLQQANDYHIYAQKLFIDYLLSGEASKDAESQGARTRESLEDERKQLVVLGDEFHKTELEHNALIALSQNKIIEAVEQWRILLQATTSQTGLKFKELELSVTHAVIDAGIIHALVHSDLHEFGSSTGVELFIKKMNESMLLELDNSLVRELAVMMQPLIELSSRLEQLIAPYIEQAQEMNNTIRSHRSQFHDTILRIMDLIRLLPDYKINEIQDSINRESLYFNQDI